MERWKRGSWVERIVLEEVCEKEFGNRVGRQIRGDGWGRVESMLLRTVEGDPLLNLSLLREKILDANLLVLGSVLWKRFLVLKRTVLLGSLAMPKRRLGGASQGRRRRRICCRFLLESTTRLTFVL